MLPTLPPETELIASTEELKLDWQLWYLAGFCPSFSSPVRTCVVQAAARIPPPAVATTITGSVGVFLRAACHARTTSAGVRLGTMEEAAFSEGAAPVTLN